MDLREIDLNLLVVFNQLLLDRSVSTAADKALALEPNHADSYINLGALWCEASWDQNRPLALTLYPAESPYCLTDEDGNVSEGRLDGNGWNLGQASRIGIVDHVAGQAGHIGKQVGGIGLNPALVDVGRALGDAVVDGGGKAAAHRSFPVEMFDQRLEGMGDGGRGGRLRRHQTMALANQLARFGIDQASLDP